MAEMIVETRPGVFFGGLRLVLANKRALLWVYLVNLVVGLLGALPFLSRLSPFLNHSLASQRIASQFDIGFVAELFIHANERPSGANTAATLVTILYVLVSYVLAAGILFVFLSAEPARFATIAGSGAAYFWRFVRLTLFLLLIGGPILGILFGIRAAYLSSADDRYVELAYDVRALVTFLVIAVIAVFLRLWFDIAEAMVVRNGIAGDRAVRRTIGPSVRLLWRNLFRAYVSYLVVGLLGLLTLGVFAWFWSALSPRAVVFAAVLGQIGIFLLLASRIWQRGIAATLVMSEPVVVPVVVVVEPIVEPPSFESVDPPRVVDVPPHGEEPGPIAPVEPAGV